MEYMHPYLVAETEEELEKRLQYDNPSIAAVERRRWRGTKLLYEQQERMILALNRLAAACEKGSHDGWPRPS